jgi:hypothetical protein
MTYDGVDSVWVAGTFSGVGSLLVNNIAKWNNSTSTWEGVGSGITLEGSNNIAALAGSGESLYVGGSFEAAGGLAVNNIAKWNGAYWLALGGGVNGTVRALAVGGTNLYVGGAFSTAGGNAANHIAKWTGTAWEALGGGVNGNVNALAYDGIGNLYVAGDFTSAEGKPANHIARWNITTSSWEALGAGIATPGASIASLVYHQGSLYIGGLFNTADGMVCNNILAWGKKKNLPAASGI